MTAPAATVMDRQSAARGYRHLAAGLCVLLVAFALLTAGARGGGPPNRVRNQFTLVAATTVKLSIFPDDRESFLALDQSGPVAIVSHRQTFEADGRVAVESTNFTALRGGLSPAPWIVALSDARREGEDLFFTGRFTIANIDPRTPHAMSVVYESPNAESMEVVASGRRDSRIVSLLHTAQGLVLRDFNLPSRRFVDRAIQVPDLADINLVGSVDWVAGRPVVAVAWVQPRAMTCGVRVIVVAGNTGSTTASGCFGGALEDEVLGIDADPTGGWTLLVAPWPEVSTVKAQRIMLSNHQLIGHPIEQPPVAYGTMEVSADSEGRVLAVPERADPTFRAKLAWILGPGGGANWTPIAIPKMVCTQPPWPNAMRGNYLATGSRGLYLVSRILTAPGQCLDVWRLD